MAQCASTNYGPQGRRASSLGHKLQRWLAFVFAAAPVLPTLPASAIELRQGDLSFSDEGGGFTLKSVSGKGTLDAPFVIVEDVDNFREAVLVIRGFPALKNKIGTFHTAGAAFVKVVTNRSKDVWQNYQLELREVLSRHSSYEDGLSFAQNTPLTNTYTTSTFPIVQRIDEPEDVLAFSGKEVKPGETAEFRFLITDMSPVSKFYLLQQPLQPVSNAPSPGVSPAKSVIALLPHPHRPNA